MVIPQVSFQCHKFPAAIFFMSPETNECVLLLKISRCSQPASLFIWMFFIPTVSEGESGLQNASHTLPPISPRPLETHPSSPVAVVLLLSCGQLFATPWTMACQTSLSITNSQSLLKLSSIELVMSPNHLILCHPLLLLPSIFPSIRVFSMSLFLALVLELQHQSFQ